MNLGDLRKDYLKTQSKQPNWSAVENKLGAQNINLRTVLHATLITITIMVLSISAITVSSQKSKPGEALYGVKIASDNLYSKISGNFDTSIEKRAQDVISSQNSPQQLNDATKQYKKTLEESKQRADQKGQSEEFKQTLQLQEEKFERAKEENHNSQQKLEEVINESKKVRGEIEGVRDQKQNEDNQNK